MIQIYFILSIIFDGLEKKTFQIRGSIKLRWLKKSPLNLNGLVINQSS